MPYYGEEYEGKWWNGRDWQGINGVKTSLTILEFIRQHDIKNAHPEGCFKCPRCRLNHYIPSNPELLCDGCCTSPKWDLKDLLIKARMEFRNLYSCKLQELHISKQTLDNSYKLSYPII